jgi:transposase
MRWVKRYNEENGIKRHNKKSMSYKVKKEHVIFILNEIKKNKTITMAELKEKINDVFNISLSRYHINRIVKDNNYKR